MPVLARHPETGAIERLEQPCEVGRWVAAPGAQVQDERGVFDHFKEGLEGHGEQATDAAPVEAEGRAPERALVLRNEVAADRPDVRLDGVDCRMAAERVEGEVVPRAVQDARRGIEGGGWLADVGGAERLHEHGARARVVEFDEEDALPLADVRCAVVDGHRFRGAEE